MGKPDQVSAAAEEARRATGGAAGRGRGDDFRPGASARQCCVCCAERISSPWRGSWGSRRRGPRSDVISFWSRTRRG